LLGNGCAGRVWDYRAEERSITMKPAKYHENEKESLAPVSRTNSPFWPTLQRELDRFFGDPFANWLTGEPNIEDWTPPVNVYEEKNNLVIKAELPGMKKDEFEIYISGDYLNITGERRAEHEEKTVNIYRLERYFGHFHRMIPLPVPIKADAIEAHYRDGILTITCPKTDKAKRKQVEVKVC
jgi:HSP20 family protein